MMIRKLLNPSSFCKYTNIHFFQAEGETLFFYIMLSFEVKDTRLSENSGNPPLNKDVNR